MKAELKVLLLGAVAILAEWAFDLGPEGMSESRMAVIPLAIPIIAAALTAVGGATGTILANKRQAKIEGNIDKQERRLDAWRDSQMSTSYLDRADSREMLRRVAQHNEEQMKALNTNAIKGGASEEAKVAAAVNLGRNYADAIGSIAAAGQRHRDAVQNQYLQGIQGIDAKRLEMLMNDETPEKIASTISGLGKTVASFA